MAEFSRQARSKRILESIDTKKSSKKQVYDFYQRWRKQYGVKGKGLDFQKAKKEDIVRELYVMEARQHVEIQQAPVKLFEKQYKQAKELPVNQAAAALTKLQKKAEKLEKAGKITKQQANVFQATTQQPKPRKKSSSTGRTKPRRKNTYYKGRFAHDYIKKMVDDSILDDTDDFDDSQEIWYALDLIDDYSEDFNFFKEHYSGNYKEGSKDYYLGENGFEDFLDKCRLFEDELSAAGKKIPDRYSQEYWDQLSAWLKAQGGTPQL